jgi:two-component system CheB/CheR fusion protein
MASVTLADTAKGAQQLLQGERLFEKIAATSPDLIYVCDLFGRYTAYINPAVKRVLGYTPGEIAAMGEGVAGMLHPQDLAPAFEHHAAFARLPEDSTAEIEVRMRHANGSYRWLRCRETVFQRDAKGRPTHILGLAEDITDQKAQAEDLRLKEEKLRSSEALFRTLGEASPMVISLTDSEGRIRYVSPAWTELSGRPAEDFLRGDWRQAIHSDDLPVVAEAWKRAKAERSGYECEFRARAADGSYRWMLTRARPVGSGGELLWIHCSLDIDDRKNAEERMREADRRKDEFIATLAHELRNPLAPMRTSLDVLQQLPADAAERPNMMAIIDRQVTHMTRLVEDLLEVSRITRGMIELRKEFIDLGAVVRHCAEAAAPMVAAGEQTLALDLPDEPLPVAADPVRLSQVITNLLSNACKYTDQRGRIMVCARREDGAAVLQVRDDGLGIPEDMLARVFEPFTQIDRSFGRARGGLGIGLTLVKQLVEMHGGSVTAESGGEGQGALFTVRLPVADGAEQQVDDQRAERDAPRTDASLRVLVVDDNEDAVISESLIMRLDGNDVRTAHDGDEAERVAEAFRPHVVLLDIGMPGRNGYEVAKRMRAEPWSKGMLLVAVTGWGQEQDRQRSKEAGFDAHLVKPVDHAELSRLLASFRRAPEMTER